MLLLLYSNNSRVPGDGIGKLSWSSPPAGDDESLTIYICRYIIQAQYQTSSKGGIGWSLKRILFTKPMH